LFDCKSDGGLEHTGGTYVLCDEGGRDAGVGGAGAPGGVLTGLWESCGGGLMSSPGPGDMESGRGGVPIGVSSLVPTRGGSPPVA
jgi:hypothetical protein